MNNASEVNKMANNVFWKYASFRSESSFPL